MDQRIYHGDYSPDTLADYLVRYYNPLPGGTYGYAPSVAQRIGQGERVMVQIMRNGTWGRSNETIGVNIDSIPGGVAVSIGRSEWLNEGTVAGMVLGALFFPPLLLFPLFAGLTHFNAPQRGLGHHRRLLHAPS
jgi:hypothetical protein